ncbi:hypothetical protein IFR05_012316 [Cadophora sp. M221]|nr:hypothetical protein IFR05_012316 [Cadophora sp. M221]
MSSLTKLSAIAYGSVDIDETILVSPLTDQAPTHDPLHLDETILVSSSTDLAATDNLSHLEKPRPTQDLSRVPAIHSSDDLRTTSMAPAIGALTDACMPHNLLSNVSSQNPDDCVQIRADELEAFSNKYAS